MTTISRPRVLLPKLSKPTSASSSSVSILATTRFIFVRLDGKARGYRFKDVHAIDCTLYVYGQPLGVHCQEVIVIVSLFWANYMRRSAYISNIVIRNNHVVVTGSEVC